MNFIYTHIKTGMFQFKLFTVINLVQFCDGILYAYASLVQPIIKQEWNLSQSEDAQMASSFIIGIVIGSFLCAFIADLMGRKKSYVLFLGLSVFSIYYLSLVSTILQMLLVRLVVGMTYGITMPLGHVFSSESVESKFRGRFGLSLTISIITGKIYLVFLCFFYLQDLKTGNWRGMILLNLIPITLAFLGSIFILQETVRFQLAHEQYSQAFKQIDQMSIENNKDNAQLLTDNDKDGIIKWQITQRTVKNIEEQGILSRRYVGQTLRIWGLMILANLQNMSLFLLMPYLFAESNSSVWSVFLVFVSELLAAVLIYFVIDNKQYGGRIKVLLGSTLLLLIANTGLYFLRESFLVIGMQMIKVGTRGLFSTVLLVGSESYPTKLRSKISGTGQGIGKIASIPTPFLMLPLYYIDPYLPFLVLGILVIVMLIIVLTYPEDKTQQPLEGIKNQ
ncbi:hypothetical protein pb186bvf_018908 [Paramecium bursaria]